MAITGNNGSNQWTYIVIAGIAGFALSYFGLHMLHKHHHGGHHHGHHPGHHHGHHHGGHHMHHHMFPHPGMMGGPMMPPPPPPMMMGEGPHGGGCGCGGH